MRFYLGTHEPTWLARTELPLFLSRRVLARKPAPRATTDWVLDSGGFTELGRGRWSITVDEYAAEIRRHVDQIGRLQWAAPMDYMCEPSIRAATGLSVAEHQARTIRNYLELRDRVGTIVAPVVQGWELDEYLRHVDDYTAAGVDLSAEPIVAIGSICRRRQDRGIHTIIRRLAAEGLTMHTLGVRAPALAGVADVVASSDSLSWSLDARYAAIRGEPIDHVHPRGGRACNNCLIYAERWHARAIEKLERSILYTGART